jgi:putative cardiolipin synthase
MRAVRSELLVVTPYCVPTRDEIAVVSDLRQRGVAVRVLTNSLESSRDVLAMAGYSSVRRRLLDSGVELHELRASPGARAGSGQPMRLSRFGHYGLHAKLFVFDRSRVFFGSMNFDERSRHLNTELGLVVESPTLAEQTAARFDAMTRPENAYALSLRSLQPHGRPQIVWRTEEQGVSIEVLREPGNDAWRRAEMHVLSFAPVAREL